MDVFEDGAAGRTFVVTGCSSGIGRATVGILATAGARVIGLDLVPPSGIDIEFHTVDLAVSTEVERAVEELPGEIHGLVNAAGVSSGIGDPLKVVGINLLGLRQLTEAVVPRMPPESYIVSTSSLAAAGYRDHRDVLLDLLATPDREAALAWCRDHLDVVGNGYSLSKEAVIYYTALRAVDLAGRGIRINCTAPGVTDTPILRHSIEALGQEYLDSIPKPLGRLSTAHEQARVLAFLIGPGASYISGQTIWVDGGYTAGAETGEFSAFDVERQR